MPYSTPMESPADSTRAADLRAGAGFLARLEPFKGLGGEELERVMAAMDTQSLAAGEVLHVEGGAPGTYLYVVRSGTLELEHQGVVVDILARGDVFGHPTLLTGEAPEFTTRAREESELYRVPGELALEILSRPEGVRFVARALRGRLIVAARTMRALPDVRTRTVASLVRRPPVFCDPGTSIVDAAELMAREHLSALLVRARDGLGIVTDRDLRDKVVAVRAPLDGPVSGIMTQPVRTVDADTLAPEASITMLEAGVNHLPVVDAHDQVIGIFSASSLMALDALSPFALRHSILAARTIDEVVEASAEVPHLFVDLLDAHLDAAALMRILTLLSDAQTIRLLQLAVEELGEPPVAYAWLALGSAARGELTLASDQDNGLAHAESDDPAVGEYFRRMAEVVNAGLDRCGFRLDAHGVVASSGEWRLAASGWRELFASCLKGWDTERLVRASICFDFRQVAGDLDVVPPLQDIMRRAQRHDRFLGGLSDLGADIRSPLGFRQRLSGPVDVKKSGLLPIQNLARYYAFNSGFTPATTLERLLAVEEAGVHGSESARSLREAFVSLSHLRLRHHANAIRAGRTLDDVVDTERLRPLTRASLQEALRVVLAAQKRPPARPAI